jgi:hypothetical protein
VKPPSFSVEVEEEEMVEEVSVVSGSSAMALKVGDAIEMPITNNIENLFPYVAIIINKIAKALNALSFHYPKRWEQLLTVIALK